MLSSLAGGVLRLTLNRPEKRNALDSSTIAALTDALAQAELDSAVRVVAISGAGKDFCAGADLDELLASANQPPEENEKAAARLGAVFSAIRRLPKPVVAVVHGRALAGGAGLVTGCDLAIAAQSAQFGYPEVQRGFVPAMVMTMLRRVVGEKRGFDLVATGRLVGAPEALELGLVSQVVPDAGLETSANALLAQLAGSSASAMSLIKRLYYELDGRGFDEGIALGARVNAIARAHPDFRTAIASFLKK
ncbi:MAG: enoyl-CoA hydratase/isomerase family protein [Gemmatimonadales bacterium]